MYIVQNSNIHNWALAHDWLYLVFSYTEAQKDSRGQTPMSILAARMGWIKVHRFYMFQYRVIICCMVLTWFYMFFNGLHGFMVTDGQWWLNGVTMVILSIRDSTTSKFRGDKVARDPLL